MVASSRERVTANTSEAMDRKVRQATQTRLREADRSPEGIDRRLDELDQEWDIERAIQANAATLALTGTVLGLTVDRRWFALSAGVMAFLLQHAVQGWCPPVPILRAMGFRTPAEIEEERDALLALRGDQPGAAAARRLLHPAG